MEVNQAPLLVDRAAYDRDGFVTTRPVVPAARVDALLPHVEDVVDGRYETGIEPEDRTPLGAARPRLVKLDSPQRCNRAIAEMIRAPEIAAAAHQLTGAAMVQVFHVQLVYKLPAGEGHGSIGWHQDHHYWRTVWEGECFTAWLALSDVGPDSGPVRFVRGSHRWGYLQGGDYSGAEDVTREQVVLPTGEAWEDVPALLAPGAVSFHHRLTLHGSPPNTGSTARIGLAIHLRTERSRPIPSETYEHRYEDLDLCPVVYGA